MPYKKKEGYAQVYMWKLHCPCNWENLDLSHFIVYMLAPPHICVLWNRRSTARMNGFGWVDAYAAALPASHKIPLCLFNKQQCWCGWTNFFSPKKKRISITKPERALCAYMLACSSTHFINIENRFRMLIRLNANIIKCFRRLNNI